MIAVIDTNVLLMSLPRKSPYHFIIRTFNEGQYNIALTTEIFLEYEEILKSKANAVTALNILSAFVESPNIIPIDVHFKWNLIDADKDDNKFIDAYLASDADYLVTNDAHFNEAKNLNFPKVNIVSADDFLQILKSLFGK
ncbi:putative toxin-antitoxin system toxin component, PIN family [Parafilimonas terrae]|uniref:Putative toxin-antitoxin system toxin component, PIN family n=1 Tax=Parafilimonas terrae TaxID=1465490 RepID=A0A1I5WCA7_9BACT|nr:putative toxin-antitoxin system toxin component, PIN family [Parafilimonas terrae]SFQ17318.1 putative toxin-antitoxin system toxin component, PIN family [Parafilimonas terrae]